MGKKPSIAIDYSPAAAKLARSACLYIATKLGDLRDELVIVGGMTPSLLIPQETRIAGQTPHIGTMDVDVGLALAILNEQRYRELCDRLRDAGFRPDANAAGRVTSQRWGIDADGRHVTVDFLIPASSEVDRGGTLRNLEHDFAAIITPGLELAFVDRRLITLTGTTILHEQATREIWVCEAGAFSVLKALALAGRGENKDAYDLVYLLTNYGRGIEGVFDCLKPLLNQPIAVAAVNIMERDFSGVDSLGAVRYARFLGDARDENLRADAAGAVSRLVKLCRAVMP